MGDLTAKQKTDIDTRLTLLHLSPEQLAKYMPGPTEEEQSSQAQGLVDCYTETKDSDVCVDWLAGKTIPLTPEQEATLRIRLQINKTPAELAPYMPAATAAKKLFQAENLIDCYTETNNPYMCVDWLSGIPVSPARYESIRDYFYRSVRNVNYLSNLIAGENLNSKNASQYERVAGNLTDCYHQKMDPEQCMTENDIVLADGLNLDETIAYENEFEDQFHKRLTGQWSEKQILAIRALISLLPAELATDNRFLKKIKMIPSDDTDFTAAGQYASYASLIELKDALVLLHEIGHSYSNGPYQQAFDKFKTLSGWKNVNDQFVIINNNLVRSNSTGRFYNKLNDIDRDGDGTIDGKITWHYKERIVWVINTDAKFISDYAKTDPDEDFAESFEAYFLTPETLKEQCPEKYQFMQDLFGK